jgi:hypothetical protein
VRQPWAIKEKHAPAGDNKARESEQDEHRQPRKSTHQLETRRHVKVSKMRSGNCRKAHTF